jgi:hypothetical protein
MHWSSNHFESEGKRDQVQTSSILSEKQRLILEFMLLWHSNLRIEVFFFFFFLNQTTYRILFWLSRVLLFLWSRWSRSIKNLLASYLIGFLFGDVYLYFGCFMVFWCLNNSTYWMFWWSLFTWLTLDYWQLSFIPFLFFSFKYLWGF